MSARSIVAGVAATLVVLSLMAATSGGFPSRPRLTALGVGTTAPASVGGITATGPATFSGRARFTGSFTNPGTTVGGLFAGNDVANAGSLLWNNSAAAANEHYWRCGLAYDGNNIFSCQTVDDGWTTGTNWLQATRTGGTVGTLIFGSPTTPDFNLSARSTGTGHATIAVDATGVDALCMTMNKTASLGGCNMPAGQAGLKMVGPTPIDLYASSVRVNGVDVSPTTSTATGTATGCTTAPTNTLRFTKLGRIVVVHIGGIGCTSNAGTFTLTGAVPAAYQPQRNQNVICLNAQDNGGAGEPGQAFFQAGSSTLQIFRIAAATFTAAGGKSISDATCTYSLD